MESNLRPALNSGESNISSSNKLNLQQAGEGLATKFNAVGQQLSTKLSAASEQMTSSLNSAVDVVRTQSKEFTRAAQTNIRQYPVAYVAGAFVTGFLVARIVRRLR